MGNDAGTILLLIMERVVRMIALLNIFVMLMELRQLVGRLTEIELLKQLATRCRLV